MSTHADCGEDIAWVRRSDDTDRWMPPLEFAGYRYVTQGEGEDKTAIQVPTYIIHHCNPEKVVAWNLYKEKLAEVKLGQNIIVQQAQISNHRAARERDREDAWAYSLKHKCPRVACGAEEGELCTNLALKKKGTITPTKNPHPERVDPHFVDRATQLVDEGREAD